jgi:nicotinamide-nucleotide amidase
MTKTSEVEVVLIGNELLKGERRDAHLAYIGGVLMTVGVRVTMAHVVGDDRGRIADLVKERTGAARAVILSGGLGPTHDDITREAVAAGLDLPLE